MTDSYEQIDKALDAALSDQGRDWLAAAVARVGEDGAAVFTLFPAAGRKCGRGPLLGWTVDQAARARLLRAAGLRGAELGRLLFDLYRHGDAAERLGVLRALEPLADGLGTEGVRIVEDALRTNDTRLIEAAMGPYAAGRLGDDAYRQAVLKCVFVGVPLDAVAGLARRADHELARMLAGYAHERLVAGRTVPADVWPVLRDHPDVLGDVPELVAALNESKG